MSTTWRDTGHGPRRLRDAAGQPSRVRPQRLRSGHEAVSPGASRRERSQAPSPVQAGPAGAAQDRGGLIWRLGPLALDADGMFAFLMFVPLLFVAQLGMKGAAIFAALVPAYLFFRREQLLGALYPRAFLLLVPGLALFSTIWSEAPGQSFKLGVEFAITVAAGLLISSARDQVAVLKGLAAAFALYVAVAVAFGGSVAIGVGAGGYAFSGLSGSKNLLGDIASSGLIISVALGMIAVRRREPLWLLICGAAALLDLYVVIAARSAGALLGLAMGAAALVSLAPLLAVGPVVRAWLTGAVALCLLSAGFSYRWIVQTMIQVGAEVFDKDPTLTGRTYLWWRASDLIHEKPLLGRGYQAFWMQGNIDAEGFWRYFGIVERGGFTFHNTAVELLVTLGWVGLVLVTAVVLVGATALVRRFVTRPDLALVCWMSLFLYQLARTPIETIGVTPFYFSTVLAFAALGYAFTRVPAAQHAPAYFPQAPRIAVRMVDYTAAGWASPASGPRPLRIRSPEARP